MITSWLNFGPYLELFYFYIRLPIPSSFNYAAHWPILSRDSMRHLQLSNIAVQDEGNQFSFFLKTR